VIDANRHQLPEADRMNVRNNGARPNPVSSNRVVHRVLEEGWAVAAAVDAFALSRRNMRKWLADPAATAQQATRTAVRWCTGIHIS
jgi:hypothetical protein